MATKKKNTAPATPAPAAKKHSVSPDYILANYSAKKQDWNKYLTADEATDNHTAIEALINKCNAGELSASDL